MLKKSELTGSVPLTVKKIRKRSGRVVKFNPEKIHRAIEKAFRAVGEKDGERVLRLTAQVVEKLEKKYDGHTVPGVEEIQNMVEEALMAGKHFDVARAYILYRDLHNRIRSIYSLIDSDELIGDYLSEADWRVKENSNMAFSLQGLNNHVASVISSNYWLNKIYPAYIREAHLDGDFHLHDLQMLAAYCCGWDLRDFLVRGFGGVSGKIECQPPKHLSSALGQLVNLFYTLQGETAGAQAVSNFDTLMAPFIAYGHLTFKQVKQEIQAFLFNMNVPTRVGFQCFSEDTEILTNEGWRTHDQIKEGTIIKTFNLKKGLIEEKQVKSVFRKKYSGPMYNLKNRIQDQLISPKHRVVRKKFQTENYALEPIEEIVRLKSPFIIPVAAANSKKDQALSDEQIKLMAWIIGEGSIERPGKHRCCYRVSIYQSAVRNKDNYEEIKNLLTYFGYKFDEYTQHGLGEPVQRMRLNAESSKKIHEWFSKENVKFIPEILLKMSQRQSKLFLDTYLKAEGFEETKIAVSDIELLNDLQAIAVNAGYGSTVLARKPTIGTKTIYVLRLIKHQDTYITKVSQVPYAGIIWCPNTENETVVARRHGKVFISGNTPFTNVTMDLKVPKFMAKEPVIIGGKPQKRTYGSFQKEVDLFNKAFAEALIAGDAKGRVFTFPIPTYNITKDFDWGNPNYEGIWEMTRKYGLPYFSNFINSDMKPEDARSMCCRLRLDNRELTKRGGGLFGANPLTGSLGVITINLPRIGFLAKTKKDYFSRLGKMVDLAKEALLLKRDVIENLTEKGLYPYSRVYLESVKKRFGAYWKNHFNTIGIIGMNESLLNFMGKNVAETEGHDFALEILDFMREKLLIFQKETDQMFNLEATPAEGTSFRLAKIDKKIYPQIICANEVEYKKGAAPFYTNSSHLPVNFTDDLFKALNLQDDLQTKYTGGTVLHGFLGESPANIGVVKSLVKKIAENYHLPYYTLTPTFSVCPSHGYLKGEISVCPDCGGKCEIYSRVVGYLRPVAQWNDGKRAEFGLRQEYQV